MFDEEVMVVEQEFSDDEKEQEAKKQRKMKRQRKQARPGVAEEEGEFEGSDDPQTTPIGANNAQYRGGHKSQRGAGMKRNFADRGHKRFRKSATNMPVYTTNQSVLQQQTQQQKPF